MKTLSSSPHGRRLHHRLVWGWRSLTGPACSSTLCPFSLLGGPRALSSLRLTPRVALGALLFFCTSSVAHHWFRLHRGVTFATLTAMTLRIAGYARLSVATDESTSIAGQKAVVEAWAKAQGAEVAEWYIDDGISGSKNVVRPAYERLVADVEAGLYQVVAVKSLDRLGRRLRSFIEFADAAKAVDCRVVAVESGLDTGSPMGMTMLSVLAVFAQHEASAMGERQKVSQQQRRQQRGRALGAAGFGFKNVKRADGTYREIDEAQAAIVRDVVDRLIAGESYRGLAGYLNDLGVVSSKGARFTASQVQQTFTSPVIAGMRTHRGEILRGDDGLPDVDADLAIIDLPTWQALQSKLKERRSYAPRVRQGKGPLLLQGLARCAGCGKPLGRSMANGSESYRCAGRIRRECDEPATIKASLLDDYVIGELAHLGSMHVVKYVEIEDSAALARKSLLAAEIDSLAVRIGSAPASEIVDLAERLTRLREEHDGIVVNTHTSAVATGETFADLLAHDPRALAEIAFADISVRRATSSHEPASQRVSLIWNDDDSRYYSD